MAARAITTSRRTSRSDCSTTAVPTDAELVTASGWLDQANPALGNIDKAIVDRIHELGMETHVWTVNGGQDMYRAIEWQVDGIITNYPAVLEDILKG